MIELINNLSEQIIHHIKMNLKNCLNIGSEKSAVDTAFMYSLKLNHKPLILKDLFKIRGDVEGYHIALNITFRQ